MQVVSLSPAVREHRPAGDLRLAVVGAPSDFARRRVPKHPRDLVEHDCLNWHPTPDSPAYRWEFTENGRDFAVAVRARVLSTHSALNRRLAIAGLGVTLAFEAPVRDTLARGELVRVLEKFCEPFPATTCTTRSGGTPRARCARWSSTCSGGGGRGAAGSGRVNSRPPEPPTKRLHNQVVVPA